MSSHLGADQAIDLVDGLRKIVREFAEKEEKLDREFRVRIARLHQRRDDGIEEWQGRLAQHQEQENAAFEAARNREQSLYESRKSRISEAHKATKKTALANIENKEGRRKHKLQTETLQSKRNRETGLAQNEQTYAEFKAALADDQQTLAGLEATALKSFGGYRKFRSFLARAHEDANPDLNPDEYQLLNELRALEEKTGEDLRHFRGLFLPAFFRCLALWVLLVVAQVPLVAVLQFFGVHSFTYQHAVISVAGCLVLGFVLHSIGKSQGTPLARKIASNLGKGRKLLDACAEKCETRHSQEIERIETEFQNKNQWINTEWDAALDVAGKERETWPNYVEEKATRATATNERLHQQKREQLERSHAEALERLKAEPEAQIKLLATTCDTEEKKLTSEQETQWQTLETEWKTSVQPIYETIKIASASADKLFPPWQPDLWTNWKPPAQFEHASKFARIDVDVQKLAEAAPKNSRLALPGSSRFSLPLLLTYPDRGSLLLETTDNGRENMIAALNNIVLRLLSSAPAGRLSFTIIDPVGLGQSFSGVMHIADYAEYLINSRIWTQTTQIEQRLADLNEHMEKVIQMYLRNEYATIAEYNEQAGNIAEKYHFLVVADFPAGFSDAAAKRLLSIASSGARCGVYTLIHWDRRQPMPQDLSPDDLRKTSVSVTCKGKECAITGKAIPGTQLLLDAPPTPEFAIDFVHKIGMASRDSNRIEVPFSHVAPPEAEIWSLDTTTELRVPIGRTGATKLQYLAMGKGTRQHGLVAGKTGSGKSTLFHVLITNLAMWCSPEQIEFYLIDFKKGVEFKCYASHRLPHARVVAIESDREFGLSVLQRLDDELKRRGDLFRNLGVQDVAGYKRTGGKEPIPRSLLVIDEFQEFFVEDDKIAQTASLLLDRIVRQGRAFGIHVLLGSQTLGGAYTVARTTLGQMVIRIALQCNEADAYLIMDDNNPAPRLLSRPGEGIYNDSAGTVEGNSPFQVVWLPDEVRDHYLAQVRNRGDQGATRYSGPLVFEGNVPADVRENGALHKLLTASAIKPVSAARIFLGAPNSIKGPTEAVFQRQSGNNLLMVGQREEAILAIISLSLISLAAQYAPGKVRFILFDSSAPDSAQREFLDRTIAAIPHPITQVKPGNLAEIMQELATEMKSRNDDPHADDAPPVFLVIHGLQKFNKLRYEEDFGFSSGDADAPANPAAVLNNLICEGTRLGFHVIAACDTYNNVNRFLSRKAFSEFEMRVLFQMSANDSASLIDSPKASALGLHRALFYNSQEGYLETFRPYSLPPAEWIDQAGQNLSRLLPASEHSHVSTGS